MKGSPVRVRASASPQSPAIAWSASHRPFASQPPRVREGYELITRLADEFLRRATLRAREFLDHVSVGVERHRRRVTGLPGDLDHRGPFCDEERDERVAQVVRPDTRHVGSARCRPSLPPLEAPASAVTARAAAASRRRWRQDSASERMAAEGSTRFVPDEEHSERPGRSVTPPTLSSTSRF